MNEKMLKADGFYDFQFAIEGKRDARLSLFSHIEEEKGSFRRFVVPWQTPIGSSMSGTKMHFNFHLDQVPRSCKHFF